MARGEFTGAQHDPVAARLLRRIKGDVGGPDDVVERPERARLGHAEAGRERRDATGLQPRGEAVAQAVEHDDRLGAGTAWQQQDELLAAPAGDLVADPGRVRHHVGEQLQCGVAHLVAVAVVQHLEQVEIAHRQRERHVLAELAARFEVEPPTVLQTRERVRHRLGLGRAHRADHAEPGGALPGQGAQAGELVVSPRATSAPGGVQDAEHRAVEHHGHAGGRYRALGPAAQLRAGIERLARVERHRPAVLDRHAAVRVIDRAARRCSPQAVGGVLELLVAVARREELDGHGRHDLRHRPGDDRQRVRLLVGHLERAVEATLQLLTTRLLAHDQLAVTQVPEHRVERRGEPAGLVVPADRHLAGKIAVRRPFSRLLNTRQRVADRSGDREAQQRHEHDGDEGADQGGLLARAHRRADVGGRARGRHPGLDREVGRIRRDVLEGEALRPERELACPRSVVVGNRLPDELVDRAERLDAGLDPRRQAALGGVGGRRAQRAQRFVERTDGIGVGGPFAGEAGDAFGPSTLALGGHRPRGAAVYDVGQLGGTHLGRGRSKVIGRTDLGNADVDRLVARTLHTPHRHELQTEAHEEEHGDRAEAEEQLAADRHVAQEPSPDAPFDGGCALS